MREELKYVLPVDVLPRLRRALRPFMRLDPYGVGYEEVGYTVRSIYLDTASLRYYREKVGHLQHRKKLRVRGYNDPGDGPDVFLEIKRKSNTRVSKDRAQVAHDALLPLLRTGRLPESGSEPARAAARRFCYHLFRHRLRPTCLVAYEREAFLGRFDRTFRVTLDRAIRSAMYPELTELYCDRGLREVMPGSFVMEVKYSTRMPAWMRQVIAELGVFQEAASKYCLGVDAFDRRIDTKTAVAACARPAARPSAAEITF